jgi:hypothetical protein
MKNITKIFVVTLSVVFCVSVGKMIIDNANVELGINAEPLAYEVKLDDTNRYSVLGSTPISLSQSKYVPSRFVEWEISGPAYAPDNSHIGFNYSKGETWAVNSLINTTAFKGIQSLAIDYTITGTFQYVKLIYASTVAPVEATAGATVVDLMTSSSPVVLDTAQLSSYQTSFFVKIQFLTTSTAAVFIINSITATYTCIAD